MYCSFLDFWIDSSQGWPGLSQSAALFPVVYCYKKYYVRKEAPSSEGADG